MRLSQKVSLAFLDNPPSNGVMKKNTYGKVIPHKPNSLMKKNAKYWFRMAYMGLECLAWHLYLQFPQYGCSNEKKQKWIKSINGVVIECYYLSNPVIEIAWQHSPSRYNSCKALILCVKHATELSSFLTFQTVVHLFGPFAKRISNFCNVFFLHLLSNAVSVILCRERLHYHCPLYIQFHATCPWTTPSKFAPLLFQPARHLADFSPTNMEIPSTVTAANDDVGVSAVISPVHTGLIIRTLVLPERNCAPVFLQNNVANYTWHNLCMFYEYSENSVIINDKSLPVKLRCH